MTEATYYSMLEVPETASAADIKSAYRRLALRYHPDRRPGPEAEERIREINLAYSILSDAQKKRAYDQQLLFRRMGGVPRQKSRTARPQPAASAHQRSTARDRARQRARQRQYQAARAQREAARREAERPLTWRERLPTFAVMSIVGMMALYFVVIHKHVVYPTETTKLTRKRLPFVPAGLRGQTHIKRLHLDYNAITELEPFLMDLNQLEILNLNGNDLRTIPSSIQKLQRLRALHLENNQLVSLPESIVELKNLKILTLSDNPLVTMPRRMDRMKHLKVLKLIHTELTDAEQDRLRKALPNTFIQFRMRTLKTSEQRVLERTKRQVMQARQSAPLNN